MTNQDWSERYSQFILSHRYPALSYEMELRDFIIQEIQSAEERGRREVIEELRKYATISPDSQTPYVDGTIIGLADDLKAKFITSNL